MGLSRKLADLGKFIDSAATSDFLTVDDSGGKFRDVLWTEIAGKPTTLDSAAAQAIVDSAYVQARQVDVGLDSALVTSLVDSSYVQARQGDVGLDSAGITGIVDSAYVNARITSGLDSAGTISLIDSTYVDARTTANSGFKNYRYTATAGQTAFTNSDENGSVLSYSGDALLVFYNGVVLEPTVDYSTSGSNTVTLTEGADSGVSVNISTWTISTSSSGSSFSWGGDRGTFAGGYTSTFQNVIDYVDITSAGNASDFGDLTDARNGVAATASTTRNVFAQGWNGSVYSNVLDYITTASTGNATDFGDYSVAMSGSARGVTSDGTTGLFQGGWPNSGSARSNVIHKITIATTGNSTDFGDLSVPRMRGGAAGDATRGLCSSGNATVSGSNSNSNVIDYVTIATPGNAVDFGDGTLVRTELMGASDATRSLFAGGYGDGAATERVTIDYVTTQTTGNATDFGDLTGQRFDGSANSNGTKALFTGYHDNATSNIIDQVTIQTTGNATDFGDLTVARYGMGAASGTAS